MCLGSQPCSHVSELSGSVTCRNLDTGGRRRSARCPGPRRSDRSAADIHHVRAARVEVAARRRVDRARHVAAEDDPLAPLLDHRVRNRHGGEQRLGVRVQRLIVEIVAGRHLHDLAEVHHGDAVGDVLDDREVVGDEQVGQSELILQVLEQVDDLGLNRHVQRRDRLVRDDEVWVGGQRAGDADALPLAAGELVRIAVGEVGVETDRLQQLLDALVAVLLARPDRGSASARR